MKVQADIGVEGGGTTVDLGLAWTRMPFVYSRWEMGKSYL